MFRLSLLVITAFAVHLGAAVLECHMCIGSLDSDCSRGNKSSMVAQRCTAAENIPDRDVYCVTTINPESEALGRSFQRGCGYIYAGMDVCSFVIEQGSAERCEACGTDFCNLDQL